MFNMDKEYLKLDLGSTDHGTFKDFLDKNRTEIYLAVIEIFHGFLTTEESELKLKIISVINGFEWDANLIYNRNKPDVLIDIVLPHFESIDEFETCVEIKTLYQQLTVTDV